MQPPLLTPYRTVHVYRFPLPAVRYGMSKREGGGLRRSKRASRYRYLWILVPLGAVFFFYLVPGQASIA